MKKMILSIACSFLFSTLVSAQANVSFGIKGGMNIASQTVKVSGVKVTTDPRIGYHFGGFVTAMFSEKIGLQPELFFNSVGARGDSFFDGEKASDRFGYISVPIMLRYQPIKIFNIHAGPQLGVLINAKSKLGNTTFDIEQTNTLDFGAAFGAGVDLPFGLGFSARYTAGLASVYDLDEFGAGDIKVRNNVFQISTTYRFGGSD